MMNKSTLIFDKTNRFLEIMLIAIFAVLVFDVLFQVFSRYVLNTSFSWTEELARFSLIWLSILGAAYLNAKREHLSMDFLYRKLSASSKKKMSILIEVALLDIIAVHKSYVLTNHRTNFHFDACRFRFL